MPGKTIVRNRLLLEQLIQNKRQKILRVGGFPKMFIVGPGKCLRPITRWVGGVQKGQKHAYVILEWSQYLITTVIQTSNFG
jgi:hypothetical protein